MDRALAPTIIRTFEPSDTECVIALWQACGLTRPWNDPALDIERKCAVGDELFLVAATHERITGSIMAGYEGHRGWINYLAVAEDCRHQGLGRRLIQAAEKRLLALGAPKINAQIRSGNDAVISFYESMGFSNDACISMGKRLIEDR